MKNSVKVARMILAFTIAPIVPVLIDLSYAIGQPNFPNLFRLYVIVAYMLMLVVGVPIFLALRSINCLKLWQFVTSGFLCIFTVALVTVLVSGARFEELVIGQTEVIVSGKLTAEGFVLRLRQAVQNGFFGAVSATVFWVIAVWRDNSNR